MSSDAEKINQLYHKQGLTQREIGRKMDLSQPAVSRKMKRYGIDSDYGGFWNEEEIERLKDNYKEVSYEEVNELFPDRSWNAIKLKAMELGIATPQEEYREGGEVKQVLQNNAEEAKLDIDFDNAAVVSYVLGVIDGDGFTDGYDTIGLETKSEEFAEKFSNQLELLGFNPSRGSRRGKESFWASSVEFTEWLENLSFEGRFRWLRKEGDFWSYIEGAYDSDGDFSNPGPRICSYDEEEKEFLKKILSYLGLEPAIHTNNVYIPVADKERFFENVDPVYDKRKP